ncbi:MAG: hypothetical protein Q8M44_02765, partial [bacterium]|nr:hypothetical protein [bacterium]
NSLNFSLYSIDFGVFFQNLLSINKLTLLFNKFNFSFISVDNVKSSSNLLSLVLKTSDQNSSLSTAKVLVQK